MEKTDQISQIISLIFNMRQIMHEKMAKNNECQTSFLQIVTLKYIKDNKPLMKDVADFLSITPPSATSLIDNLIGSGMIVRKSNPSDRRMVRVEITKKGTSFIKNHMGEIAKKMRKGLSALTAKEQEQLSRILAKITEAYKK